MQSRKLLEIVAANEMVLSKPDNPFMKTKLIDWFKKIACCCTLFIIPPLASLNIEVVQTYSYLAEPLVLLLISAWALYIILHKKVNPTITYTELLFSLFAIYAIIRTLQTTDFSSLIYLLFSIVFYYAVKSLLSQARLLNMGLLLLWSSMATLLCYSITLGYHIIITEASIDTFFMPNKSIFSILLAAQMAFVMPLYIHYQQIIKKHFKMQLFSGLVLLLCLLILLLTNGRTGWLGLLLASIYAAYQVPARSKHTNQMLLTGIGILCFSVPLLLAYKAPSTQGRFLIYKISWQLLSDHWFWGIGLGGFKTTYPEYQAAYFTKNSINSKEALLADDTMYAFNEPLQLLIETGLIGFTLLLLAIVFFIRSIRHIQIPTENRPFLTAAVASLICIGSASLSFYPFHVLPILIHSLICLAFIQCALPIQGKHYINNWIPNFSKWVLRIGGISVLLYSTLWMNYSIQSKKAFDLSESGYKNATLNKYETLPTTLIKDGRILYLYAKQLNNSNRITEARKVIEEAHKFYCTHELHVFLASLETELNNHLDAEANYIKAIQMVPNRMSSRYQLFKHYISTKDTAKAVSWGNSILKMPIKVPSLTTSRIRKEVSIILMRLQINKEPLLQIPIRSTTLQPPIQYSPFTKSTALSPPHFQIMVLK